jgi:Type VI secretion, TssG
MDNHEMIALLQREMRRVPCDAKAEAQLAMAMEKGLQADDFFVSGDHLFHREYSKDVVFTEVKEDVRKRPILQLHLSRSGIYDQLPEGMFFQQGSAPGGIPGAAHMATAHRQNKQKEEEIRRFFLPFENDFFWQRLQLEMEETQLLEGFRSGVLNDYFMEFWNIPASIPQHFMHPFIVLLPYAHEVAGDRELTGQCLALLLQEKVQVSMTATAATEAPLSCIPEAGNQRLGIDMVCGAAFIEDSPALHFIIGPLEQSKVADYLEGGERYALLETFTRFFMAAGMDALFTVELPAEKQYMVLQEDNEPVLGYVGI